MEVDSILSEAKNNNIIHMLCVAVDLEGSPEIIALAKEHDEVSASVCLLYTSPSPRDRVLSRMPSSA